jgi:SprT-like protein
MNQYQQDSCLIKAMRLGKKQRKALGAVNLDLFPTARESYTSQGNHLKQGNQGGADLSLPSIPELYSLFRRLNAEYFQGRLPEPIISYSKRMTAAGMFMPASKEIKIGVRYHQIFPHELEDTLKHEMIHIISPRHDRHFKEIAARIGASLKARAHPELQGAFRYIYVCPRCGYQYRRRKRLRMASCGLCSPSRAFDPRYKLRLLKSPGNRLRGASSR